MGSGSGIQAETAIKEGILSKGKVIYKPETLREKVVTGIGLTTFELGEKYTRLFGKKKKKSALFVVFQYKKRRH